SSVAVVVLPASSVVVTLASTLSLLISSERGTPMFKVLPSGSTVVSYSLPPTVTVTLSPGLTSLPTVPVIVTSPPDSSLLSTSSLVFCSALCLLPSFPTRRSSDLSSVAVVVLPASSVVVTLASTLSLLTS